MASQKTKITVAVSDPVWRNTLEEAISAYIGAAGKSILLTDEPGNTSGDYAAVIAVEKTNRMRLGALLDKIARALRAGSLDWPPGLTVRFGPWTLAADDSLLTGKDSKSVRLTEKERDIILLLHAADGEPVSRRTLLDEIWGYAEGIETHTLETHIYRLRQKIEDDPAKPDYLLTAEHGYSLSCE